MAFFKTNRDLPMGAILRSGLDNLRDGLHKLKRISDAMEQMSDAQVVDVFGVAAAPGGNTDVQQAAALKAELAADVGKLFSNASQTGVADAWAQLLNQTG